MSFKSLTAYCRTLRLAVLVSSIPLACHAEGQPLKKTDLFIGGEKGFALYRIPGMVVTPKGSVLTYCEARSEANSDWGEIQVLLRRSVDSGRTWGPAHQIAHFGERIPGPPRKTAGGENEQTVHNPVAIVDHQTGAIHFLYCVNYARCFYMKSNDDGVTFTKPVEITQAFESFRKVYDWNAIATGPGHGLQLKNGRLVVPVWLAYGKVGAHDPSASGTIYSDDHGLTWHAGEIPLRNTPDSKNPNETAVAELSDGRVMLNARSSSLANRRLVTISSDGAAEWSTPSFDSALPDPQCMGSLLRIPAPLPRGCLLFCNPDSLKLDEQGHEVPGAWAPRKNLAIRISKDDGQTWASPKTIEDGSSAYSDLAQLPDGTVLCFYERICDVKIGAKSERKKMLSIARLPLDWLLKPDPARALGSNWQR
ncbi:MAG: sialidase family protein [Verrucomicrobiota bacterium]